MIELFIILAIGVSFVGLAFGSIGKVFGEDQEDPPSYRH